MAELILTEAEKAADSWADLSDEALGKLLRFQMAKHAENSAQLNVLATTAAALWLCAAAKDADAAQLSIALDGFSEQSVDYGDWRVLVHKLSQVAPTFVDWRPIATAPSKGKWLIAVDTDEGFEFAVLHRDKNGNWIHEGEPTFCKSYMFRPVAWAPLPCNPPESILAVDED